VRWERLFADLEGQLEAADDAELAADVGDRSRRELALIRLVDRLRPAIGQSISVRLAGLGLLAGRLSAVGADWLLLDEAAGREALVPARAVLSVSGLGAGTDTPGSEGAVAAKIGLAHALRGVTRDRAAVSVVLIDGSTVSGTLDRVGVDFVEIADHPAGEPRRRDAVRGVWTLPLSAVGVVRST
jgi:hypothetical protein